MKSRVPVIRSAFRFAIMALWLVTCSTAWLPDSYTDKPDGTAIVMTGASARLSQQSAMLEELYERGELSNVVFISGVSAGAINAVMLNAILTKRITWDEYREILFDIKNENVYVLSEHNRLPVNVDPKRTLLEEIVEKRLGYRTIGDLPITTEISFMRYSSLGAKRGVYRIFSRCINSESDTTMSLVDILMATTAIPVIFPPVKIPDARTIPDVKYVDGGFGADRVPYTGLLEFQNFRKKNVSKVYIISKKTGTANIGGEFRYLGWNNLENITSLGPLFENSSMRNFINRLRAYAREAPEMVPCSYVWMPDFNEDYLLLNFNKMCEQYMVTRAWAKKNDPVPLRIFLETNSGRSRRVD